MSGNQLEELLFDPPNEPDTLLANKSDIEYQHNYLSAKKANCNQCSTPEASPSRIYQFTLRLLLLTSSVILPVYFLCFELHFDLDYQTQKKTYKEFYCKWAYTEPMQLACFIFQCLMDIDRHGRKETNIRFFSFDGLVNRIYMNFGWIEALHFSAYACGLFIMRFWIVAVFIIILCLFILPLVKENLVIAKSHNKDRFLQAFHLRWLTLLLFHFYLSVLCYRVNITTYLSPEPENPSDEVKYFYRNYVRLEQPKKLFENVSAVFTSIVAMHATSILGLYEAFVMTDLIIPAQIRLSDGHFTGYIAHTIGIILIAFATIVATISFAAIGWPANYQRKNSILTARCAFIVYFSLLVPGTFCLFIPSLFKNVGAKKQTEAAALQKYFEENKFSKFLFASLRFGKDRYVEDCAKALREKLEENDIGLVIMNVELGENITRAVFEGIDRCEGFVAFGSVNYGEETGNPAATDKEIAYAENNSKKMILINMLGEEEEFEHHAAKYFFYSNRLRLDWPKRMQQASPPEVPPEVVENIAKRIKGQSVA